LSREQREQYCEDLARQLEANEDQIAEAREALTSLRSGLPPLRADVDSLRDAEARLAERLATERSKPARAPEASRPADRYVVRPGDSLWRISGEPGVYGSGERWVRLYEANRGVIRDPNVIHPGQTIRIPR
jgi:nucleoid-associated protein YgaU